MDCRSSGRELRAGTAGFAHCAADSGFVGGLRRLRWLVLLLVQEGRQLRIAQYGMLQTADRSQSREAVLIKSGQVVDEAAARSIRADTVAGEVDTLLSLQPHSVYGHSQT